MNESSLDGSKVAVIVVAPEGIVDTQKGVFVLGTHLGGINGFQLRGALQGVFRLPVVIDDPARVLTYYEKKFGAAAGRNNFIYLYLGDGVGSGIVIDGKIYRGFRGIAGEVGHIIKENILRQVKAGIADGVYTRISELCDGDPDGVTPVVLKSAADGNDKFSHNTLEYVGNHLGKAAAILVNIFNPELILLGGQ